eukprot:m.201158 g.201158  ORF g.201158 m.201158 type:complete len:67 (-) comp15743_c0_seq8:4096-4296(-)
MCHVLICCCSAGFEWPTNKYSIEERVDYKLHGDEQGIGGVTVDIRSSNNKKFSEAVLTTISYLSRG